MYYAKKPKKNEQLFSNNQQEKAKEEEQKRQEGGKIDNQGKRQKGERINNEKNMESENDRQEEGKMEMEDEQKEEKRRRGSRGVGEKEDQEQVIKIGPSNVREVRSAKETLAKFMTQKNIHIMSIQEIQIEEQRYMCNIAGYKNLISVGLKKRKRNSILQQKLHLQGDQIIIEQIGITYVTSGLIDSYPYFSIKSDIMEQRPYFKSAKKSQGNKNEEIYKIKKEERKKILEKGVALMQTSLKDVGFIIKKDI